MIRLVECRDIVNDIKKSESELEEVNHKIVNMDKVRIDKVVDIAVSGLKFEKIWQEKNISNTSKGYKYFVNEKGNFIKGIHVASKVGVGDVEGLFDKTVDKYDLWLRPKSFVLTHTTGSINTEFNFVLLNRELTCKDVDIFKLNDDNELEWNTDEIFNSIYNSLLNRKASINARVEIQKKRIKRLEELKL